MNSQSSRKTSKSVRQIWAPPIAVVVAEMMTTTLAKRAVVITMINAGTPNPISAPVAVNKINKFTSLSPVPKRQEEAKVAHVSTTRTFLLPESQTAVKSMPRSSPRGPVLWLSQKRSARRFTTTSEPTTSPRKSKPRRRDKRNNLSRMVLTLASSVGTFRKLLLNLKISFTIFFHRLWRKSKKLFKSSFPKWWET